ncbi:MAG: translocation/assembly module TamB domain-containing protein [Gemmatimonadaceae bacterium]
MRRRTAAIVGLSTIAGLVIIVVGAVLVLTRTDLGHERVRRLAVSQLSKLAHGQVSIGGVSGNILNGATFTDVTITDSSGASFIKADSVSASYSLSNLLHKRIYLNDVRLVNPTVVISRKTGGIWNYDRIFPRDTVKHVPAPPPSLGSWVTLRNLTIVSGHVTVKSPWVASDTLTPTQRDSAIKFVLGPGTKSRLNVVRADTGFQKVSDFRDIYGKMPLLRIEDPNNKRQIFDVATLRMTAEPLKPPEVRVTDLRGRFLVLDDSLYFSGIDAALASSRLSGSGRYRFSNDNLRLRLHADTVATNDLLWIDPTIPQNGTGKLDFALDWVGKTSDYQATNATMAVAGATLSGKLGIMVTDTLAFHNTDMRFTHLDTRTIQQLFPTVKSPTPGYLTGRMAVTGGFGAMHVDGDVAFDDPRTGRTRVVALGTVGASLGVLRASDLHLTLEPFQVALVHSVAPTLPVGGTITGNAILNGSSDSKLAVSGDITHDATTGRSRVVGSAVYGAGKPVPLVNANLRFLPLSLATVARFAPATGLQGTVTGPVKLSGPMRNLALTANLSTTDGGSIAAHGTLDLVAQQKGYDLAMSANLFNASSISTKAPSTSISADVTARGAGFDPATLRTVATAHVTTSRYDSVAVDSAIVRVAAANGIVTVDTLVANVPGGYANVSGEFGLTGAHVGTLHYVAAVDSLGRFSRFLANPSDTGAVPPRPGILSQRVSRARADSLRVAQATEVERAVTGKRMPRTVVDTPAAIARSTFAGSVRAEGTATGNIHTFNLNGTASGKNIVAFGSSVGAANAKYAWNTAFSPQSHVSLNLNATNVFAAGFALDTVALTAGYQKPNGTVSLVIHQDSSRVYTVGAAYALNKVRNDLRLDNMKLRFDTTVYVTTQPSLIHFGSAGVEVDHFELTSPQGGRLYVDGSVPTNGNADLSIHITQFDVGNIVALLQSDIAARGLVSVDLHAQGTRANPAFSGAFGLTRFSYGGRSTPELHGTVDYQNQTLRTNTEANREGEGAIVRARGTVPVNLAFSGVTGSRVPRDRAIDVRINTDSLPLNLVPELSTSVTNLTGTALANFTVAGTVNNPIVNGRLALRDGRMRVVPLGITLANMAGNVRLLRDTVVIDSLVATSDGPIHISGGVGIRTLAQPSFALKLTARNAEVVDNEMGDIHARADIAVQGPYNNVDVTGSTRIIKGVVYIAEPTGKTLVGAGDPALYSVIDTAITSEQQLFPTQSPLLANLRMQVAVAVSRDVFVRSKDANIELYTDGPLRVSVNRAQNSLALDGVLLSDRGEYRFQGRRFQIDRGSAVFTNSPTLNPILQVTGQYNIQVPAVTIRIIISGTLDQPKIALESDAQPPLSQTELLSYLAFGRSSSSLLQQGGSGLTTGGGGSGNLVGAGAAFAAKQVGAAALGAVTDQISGNAARSLGADYFNLAPADVSLDAGSFLRGTQVEFGKYLQTRTFLQLQVRPDPASLPRPGFQLVHRFNPRAGYRIEASFEPRYLLTEPTLQPVQTPQTTSAFGLFLVREWRY